MEQRRNRLPTTAKILHVHNWQSSSLLPWRLLPYICQQQILHWCQMQIHSYRGQGSSNWALEKCWIFVMGCPNLIVVIDHEPLKGLFGDRDLSKIPNPWLFKQKEKTLRYRFTIQHCHGKWHKTSDAVSRNPPAILQALLNGFLTEPSQLDIIESDNMDDWVKLTTLLSSFRASDNVALLSPDAICATGCGDLQYKKINRHHTKWIWEDTQPHCTRDLRVLGGEAPPHCGQWVSALGPQDCHPHFPACRCTT